MIRAGDRVMIRVGGPDHDPELRPADAIREAEHGWDFLVLLAGSQDLVWTYPGTTTPLFAEAGVGIQPVLGVRAGLGVLQWRPR